MAFIAPLAPKIETEKPIYSHGFSESEVIKIKSEREAIYNRDILKNPVSIEEFKNVIVPWIRIHRTEEFILHPEKIKVVREKKPKVIKEKKLTKKQIKDKITDIIMRMAAGEEISEEDSTFMNIYNEENSL